MRTYARMWLVVVLLASVAVLADVQDVAAFEESHTIRGDGQIEVEIQFWCSAQRNTTEITLYYRGYGPTLSGELTVGDEFVKVGNLGGGVSQDHAFATTADRLPVSLTISWPASNTTSGSYPAGTSSAAYTSPCTRSAASLPQKDGYWMLATDGRVFDFGMAGSYGTAAQGTDIEATPTGHGYWILTGGYVSAHGDAVDLEDYSLRLTPGEELTSISSTPTGRGYWIFTSLGRVFTRGDARHVGDLQSTRLNGPILDSVATPTGNGYYLVGSDGGVFSFGDAHFFGSTGAMRLNAPVRSLVPDPDGSGYWLVASDGGVFAFSAPFRGSMGGQQLNRPISGMVSYGNGYLMVAEDGGVFTFSDRAFVGSAADTRYPHPIRSIAVLPARS